MASDQLYFGNMPEAQGKKWEFRFETFRLKEKEKTKRVVAKVKAQEKACQKKRKSSGVTKKVRSKDSEHGN